ncbi:MAG TPA: PEGA domain-containing protein, partial [Polyangiaceae bacterium]|nr:PEGA domain-containing protein [Polyangiaceae bacterium]
ATPTAPSAVATPEPAAAPKSAEPAAPVAPSASADGTDVVVSKQVVLATEPIDAHIFRDGADLGQSPVAISVDEGKTVELEIQRDGFKPDKITLDGSKTRAVVKLEKLARGAAPVRANPKAKPEPTSGAPKKPKASIGGSEIVNPWGN